MKISDVVGKDGRFVLMDALQGWFPYFCKLGDTACAVFSEIIRNTVNRDQFEWSICPEKYFLTEAHGHSLIKRREMYRALRKLQDLNLIFIFCQNNRKVFYLNLPGMLHTANVLWRDTSLKYQWKPKIDHLMNVTYLYYQQNELPLKLELWEYSEHLMKLKESVDKAKSQSRDAQKRQREKRAAKEEKNVRYVMDLMKAAYEEHLPSVQYRETWTKKQKGQAANWLKELQTADPPLDPADLIDRMVKNWRGLSGRARDNYDNPLILGELPTFQVYYKFRAQIEDALIRLNELDRTGRRVKIRARRMSEEGGD